MRRKTKKKKPVSQKMVVKASHMEIYYKINVRICGFAYNTYYITYKCISCLEYKS